MRKAIIISFIILFYLPTNAQNNNTQASLYNIGLGGVFGSIGAALNKKPNEKLGKVMLKGFWQGSLGGAFVYSSKQLVYNFHKSDNLDKLWVSKLVNSAGISMIENAAANRNFYDRWHIHIGFNRIELETSNKFKLKYKIMPYALYGTILASNNSEFSLKYSVQTLTPIFITKDRILLSGTFMNSIRMEILLRLKTSLAHEFLHSLQYDDFMVINVYFDKKRTKWENNSKFIKKYSNWFYTDIPSGLTIRSLYSLENTNKKCYYDNYFEGEANFYSNRRSCN